MQLREDIRLYQGVTPVGPGGHIDVPLGNFASRAFDAGGDDLIGEQILPAVPVGRQSNKFYIIEKDAFFRIETTRRAPRTQARRVEFTVSSNAYFADNFALAADHALEDLANADNVLQLRQNATMLVTDGLRRDQEQRIANLITSIDNVGSGTQLTNGDSWFSTESADILGQVQTAQAFIRAQTGLLPNVMAVDWDSWQMLKKNTRLFEFFKFTNAPNPTDGSGLLSDQMIRTALGVDRILIGRAISNTAAEQVNVGSNTFTSANVWGNHAVLAHVGAVAGIQATTFGVRFRWQPAGFRAPFQVATAVENQAGSRHIEILEAQYFQDEQVIARDLAYVIETSSGNTGAA